MFQWTLHAGVPFTVVATKADKISKSQRVIAANKAAKLLGAPAFAIPFSAEEKIGKDALTERIGQIFEDAEAQALLAAFKGYYTMALPPAAPGISASEQVGAAPEGVGHPA